MIIEPFTTFKGEINIPGDKSISHRSIMFGALAKGTTVVKGFLQGADCLSSIDCFRQMGIAINNNADTNTVTIEGKGLFGLSAPTKVLDTGNSGTTTRLIAGILAAQPFESTLNGDASIQKRPMKRIMDPLSLMGAKITSLTDNYCAPLHITGTQLHGIDYATPMASAQVKSAILLAGLYANSPTTVTEQYVTRNHSELMLKAFGASVSTKDTTVTIKPATELYAQDIYVPGDISSAAYFIAAGLLTPNSQICIKNVGINPTRDGLIEVCQNMGGQLKLENKRLVSGELTADIVVSTAQLSGVEIKGSIIPRLIDEIPVIAVLACFANGTTVIKDAQELKVKESNRIDVVVNNLKEMGADIEATDDGMIIHGGKPLHGASIDTHMDHRIAMAFSIAAGLAEGKSHILNANCIDISYPTFFEDLNSLRQ